MMEILQIKDILEKNWDILEKSNDSQMVPTMRLLHEHLENPRSYVVFVGETSSGKSTLINALLNRRFLPAGPKPTTGTVTWIEHGISSTEKLYAVNKKDASIEEISKSQFDALARQPDENLLRLRADLPLSRPGFKGLTIFDTPGYDSIIEQHEEVLKEFLPESDIILFTLFYRVGFQMTDQEMMSLIADMDVKFGERPVFLIVNRVPNGVDERDGRIKEIRLHAEDTLHRPVKLVLVHSSLPDAAGNSTLPNVDSLWRQVADIAFSGERKNELAYKCKEVLGSLLKQRHVEICSILQAIKAGMSCIPEMEQQIANFRETEKSAYALIDKYVEKWKKQVPAKIQTGIHSLLDNIHNEIDNSSKWLDINDCRNYLFGHMIPFGIKNICREIEEYLYNQFAELDEQISEMASLTVKKLNEHAQMIQAPNLQALMSSLGLQIGYKITGQATSAITQGMGGCCGGAAGAGNLVKKVVSQFGHKVLKKTFSREVYRQIGKIFTKKLMATLTVVMDVVVEAIDYVHESLTWQKKLKQETSDILDKWYNESQEEFSSTMIAEYKQLNIKNVKESINGVIIDLNGAIQEAKKTHRQGEIAELNQDAEALKICIAQLEEA